MRQSIRTRFTCTFLVVIAAVLLAAFLMNTFGLERFYRNQKLKEIQAAYEVLNGIVMEEGADSSRLQIAYRMPSGTAALKGRAAADHAFSLCVSQLLPGNLAAIRPDHINVKKPPQRAVLLQHHHAPFYLFRLTRRGKERLKTGLVPMFKAVFQPDAHGFAVRPDQILPFLKGPHRQRKHLDRPRYIQRK